MFKKLWKWITKHRCDMENRGVLVDPGRWFDIYVCSECGKKKKVTRAMGTLEMMMATSADNEDRAREKGFIK